MKKNAGTVPYTVQIPVDCTVTVLVRAANPDQALRRARRTWRKDYDQDRMRKELTFDDCEASVARDVVVTHPDGVEAAPDGPTRWD